MMLDDILRISIKEKSQAKAQACELALNKLQEKAQQFGISKNKQSPYFFCSDPHTPSVPANQL